MEIGVFYDWKWLHQLRFTEGFCSWYSWVSRASIQGVESTTGCKGQSTLSLCCLVRPKKCLWLCPPSANPVCNVSVQYRVSEKCQRVVACLYSNLTVQVRTPDWQTGMIPFQKSVFQGDPLSVSIFNMVINMYVDQISSPRHLSLAYEYSYSNSHLLVLLTQFTDDTSIITNSVKSCQFLCNMSLQFFEWANMQINVWKCCALAVSSRPKSRVYDPKLQIGSETVPFVGCSVFKFLGLPFDMSLSPCVVQNKLVKHIDFLCEKIDALCIRRWQKIKIYQLYVCSSMSWLLGLLDLPLSWVERNIDTIIRFLKKWVGLAKKANPSVLYMKSESFGLGLPKLSSLFQSVTSCKLARLLHSEDTVAQQLAQSEVHHQFQLRSRKFVPAKLANSLSSKEIKTVIQRQTECQHEEILKRVLQGSMTRAVDVDDESIWASTLTTLPDAMYKWTVNSVVDMLPHKSNLVRWHRSVSNCCPLCSRQQTLSHVLSDCPVSLEQGRYTWQHDQILSIIKDGLKNWLFP